MSLKRCASTWPEISAQSRNLQIPLLERCSWPQEMNHIGATKISAKVLGDISVDSTPVSRVYIYRSALLKAAVCMSRHESKTV